MGCWNETDGITQLPICYKEKIRLFILLSESNDPVGRFGKGMCYENEAWKPLGFVKGEYDDYGSIENIEPSTSGTLLLKYLQDNVHEDITIQKVMESLNDWKVMRYKIGYLGMMMVLEDVYQDLVKYDPITINFHSDPVYKPEREHATNNLIRWWKEFYFRFSNAPTDNVDRALLNMSAFDEFGISFGKDPIYALYRNFLMDKIRKQDDSNLDKVFDELIDYSMFHNAMVAARKLWFPQSGRGGQHRETGVYKLIAQTTMKFSKKMEDELIEDSGDCVSEEGYSDYMLEHNRKQMAK